jgi:hypothetical protein
MRFLGKKFLRAGFFTRRGKANEKLPLTIEERKRLEVFRVSEMFPMETLERIPEASPRPTRPHQLKFGVICSLSKVLYNAPIATSARLTSSTPSGGSGACGGNGAPTG